MIGLSRLAMRRQPFMLRFVTRVSTNGPLLIDGISVPSTAAGRIKFLLDLDSVEALNPARSLKCLVYRQMPDASWFPSGGFGWGGGTLEDTKIPPWLAFDVSLLAGKTTKIEVTDPQGQQVGFKTIVI